MQKARTLVIGGAASGKSNFAESLVRGMGKPLVYIATAQAFDTEMEEKIASHRVSRGPDWDTIETPMELPKALTTMSADRAVLVDCVTFWLTNLMLSSLDTNTAESRLIEALKECASDVVLVTNEVGHGIVPDNKLGRTFRNLQGRVNQRLAEACDRVILVTAGLPMVLKGTL